MSVLPPEFVELMDKKRQLESKIQDAICDFEMHFGGIISIGDIDLLKLKSLDGSCKTIIKVSLEIE